MRLNTKEDTFNKAGDIENVEYLTRPQACKFLNISLATFDNLKDLPKIRFGRKCVRVNKADLIKWLESKKESKESEVVF